MDTIMVHGGVSAPAFHAVVALSRHAHCLTAHNSESLSLRGLGVQIGSHFVCALVLDLEIPLDHLISDKEKPFLMCLLFFPALILPSFASNMVDLLSCYKILLSIVYP